MITNCPECGHPAWVSARGVLESTDGPIEHVKILCINNHHYNLSTDKLEQVLDNNK